MRNFCITILLLVSGSASLAATPEPLCVLDPAAMPESWLPSSEEEKALSSAKPWSAAETEDSSKAIKKGMEEMIAYYAKKPAAMTEVWEDTVASVLEVTYSGANRPDIQSLGREKAREYLSTLIEPFLKRDPKSATCEEYEKTMPLTIYANNLFEGSDKRRGEMVAFTNAAYHQCGSLEDAIGYDYPTMLKSNASPVDDVFDLVIWSLVMIEGQLVPGLEMPEGAKEFPAALWKYLETYPLTDAEEFEEGASDEKFIEIAYLATHIAYIPTGNHRHPLYIEDSPNLYRFLRENFYPILEMGELDLVAEVVDTFRQYGCDEENDLQVRDGARWLLNLYHSLGDGWMAYREPDETDAEVEDYDFIHKAWTGISGVRNRVIEPAEPGTYGGVVRAWLPHPR